MLENKECYYYYYWSRESTLDQIVADFVAKHYMGWSGIRESIFITKISYGGPVNIKKAEISSQFFCPNICMHYKGINWYFLMKCIMKESCNWINFISVVLCQTTPLKVATQSTRLQPSIICTCQLKLLCFAAQVPKFTSLKSWMKAQVSLETTIEPHELVYYLGLESRAKSKSLLLLYPMVATAI